VLVDDASSATLNQVTIRNANFGVAAEKNSFVRIENGSVIEDNRLAGVALDLGSSGVVIGSTIRNDGDEGIWVFRGSSAQIEDSTIEGNVEGVALNTHSTAQLIGNTISTSTSADSAALGVAFGSTARLRGGNTLTSTAFGLYVQQGSTLIQHHKGHDRVNGPVQVTIDSNAEFRNVEISG